jgi:hypothetical protein
MDRIITTIEQKALAAEETIVMIEEGLQNGDYAHEDEMIELLKQEREYLQQAHEAIKCLKAASEKEKSRLNDK